MTATEDDTRTMTFLSDEGMTPDAGRAAMMGTPRPTVAQLRSVLLETGLTMVTSAGTGIAGADAYMRSVPHQRRRLAVDAETGDLRIESLEGGLDLDPLGTIAEVFGANPATFMPGAEGRVFVPVESRQPFTTANCVRIATRCDDFSARIAVEVRTMQATPREFVKMLVTAVVIGAGRAIAIRNDRGPNRSRLRPLRPGDVFVFGDR